MNRQIHYSILDYWLASASTSSLASHHLHHIDDDEARTNQPTTNTVGTNCSCLSAFPDEHADFVLLLRLRVSKAFQGSRRKTVSPLHPIPSHHTIMISFFVMHHFVRAPSLHACFLLCYRCYRLRCLKLAVLLRLNTWLLILYRCGWFGQATGIVALKCPLEHRKNTGRLRECVCVREKQK